MRSAMEEYQYWLDCLSSTSQSYPFMVSIETLALCNAGCIFCPYPELPRKGDRMPDELFYKIIDELAAVDGHLYAITLARVNEPFLDKRIWRFSKYINQKLPKVNLHFFSNGIPLNRTNIDRLLAVGNVEFLNVSFNDHRKFEYEQTMKIPYDTAFANLKILHGMHCAGELPFYVQISRVANDTEADVEFAKWVESEFPGFRCFVGPRADWIGKVKVDLTRTVPDIGCNQWYQLHILADGRPAFCCIDSEGEYMSGNAKTMNVIDMYNQPSMKRLRDPKLSRLKVDICKTCTLGPSSKAEAATA